MTSQFQDTDAAVNSIGSGKNHTITIPSGNRRKAPFWEKGGLWIAYTYALEKKTVFRLYFAVLS